MFSRSVYTLTDRSTIARTIKKPVFSSDYGYWLSSKGAAISLRNIVGIVLSLQSSDRAAHFGSSDHKVIRWLKASLTYEIQSQQPVRELIYHWIRKHWPVGRRDKICNSTAYKSTSYTSNLRSTRVAVQTWHELANVLKQIVQCYYQHVMFRNSLYAHRGCR